MRINIDRHAKPPRYTKRNKIETEAEKQKETKISFTVRLTADVMDKLDKMKSYGDRNATIERAVEALYQQHLELEMALRNWEGGSE